MNNKHGKKPRIVIDEDLLGSDFSSLDKKAKIITSSELMGRSGAEDIELYEKCTVEDCHIMTANVSDFRAIQKRHPQIKTGIIGITGTSRDKSIKKFSGVVTSSLKFHEQYYNKFIEASSKSVIIRSADSNLSQKKKAK